MAGLRKSVNANKAASRMKKYACDDTDSDDNDLIFLSDLKSALKNLGGRLTIKEIELLVKGIREDKEEGIRYEDIVGVLIFASFFISTFDRNGTGYVTVNELNRIMLNAKREYSSETNNNERNKQLNEDENCNFSGINQRPEEILDYTKFIETIENTRQVVRVVYILHIV